MSTNNFKTQFLDQLNNEETPLEDRLLMVYGAITSQEFPLPSKEQIIVDWFADYVEKDISHFKLILKYLIRCLKSDWLMTFSNTIDASKLIEAFIALNYDYKHRYSRTIVKCLLLLLKNFGFQRYCRFDIDPMCRAVVLLCDLFDSLNSSTGVFNKSPNNFEEDSFNSSGLEEMFEDIHNIYKITQQRNELKIQFMETILPSILKLPITFQNSERFTHLFEELVIGEDPQSVCEAFKTSSKRKKQNHLEILRNILTSDNHECDVVAVTALLFDFHVYSSTKKLAKTSSHLSLFYILTCVVGFKLELPYEVVDGSNKVISQRFSIMKELVGVLQKYNIPASSEADEGVLSTFLTVIQKQLISSEQCLSSDLLEAVLSIFIVYPESVKQVFRPFMHHVVFVRKIDTTIMKSYDNLLQGVVKIFSDLNQLEKFFSLFFRLGIVLSKEKDFSKLSSNMVLSSGFYSVLSEKVLALTGNQLKVIISSLKKVFLKDFVLPMENNQAADGSFCLLLKLMVEVLSYILEHASIAISTRWNIIEEDIENLVHMIQKFGSALLKSYENHFLREFLQLVKIMADIELLINQYIVSQSNTKILPAVKYKDSSNSVHNLSKSHGFMSSSEWKHVSELVMKSSDKHLKHCWFDLLVQKYIRLKDPEVVTFLTLNADSEWLWCTLTQLSTSVPVEHLELYTDQLLDGALSAGDYHHKLSYLKSINVVTNRPLRLTINLQSLKQIGKVLGEKSSLLGKMVKLTDVPLLIQFEADVSGEKCEAINALTVRLAEAINKCTGDEVPSPLSDEAKISILRLLDMMTVMSPYCLKIETKRIICLFLIGLSYGLRAENALLHNVLQNILGCLDDNTPVIPEALDRRVLTHWLVTVVPPSFSLRHQLTQVAIGKVVYSLGKCVDGMSQVVQGDEMLMSVMLEAIVSILGNKGLKNKEEFQKLTEQLISMASTMVVKKPKSKFLRLFTASLKAEFLILTEKSSKLLDYLPTYLDILFKLFDENKVVVPNATELVDLVFTIKAEVNSEIVGNVNRNMIKQLCRTDLCPILCYPTTVKSFLESVDDGVYETVLTEVNKHYQEKLSADVSFPVINMCEMWKIVLSAQVDKKKAKIRQKLLASVFSGCQSILEKDVSKFHPSVLQLLLSIVLTKSISLTWKQLDMILIVLGLVPVDSEPLMLPDSLSVLGALISHRAELIHDRIPVYLQLLRKFISSLVTLSSAQKDNNMAFNLTSASSVNQVSRIIKAITDHHAVHFARITPYLIADILHWMVTESPDISTKNELHNCLCWLLSICDHHGSMLLQNLLPLASIELFKVISTTYNKSYKYTGKV